MFFVNSEVIPRWAPLLFGICLLSNTVFVLQNIFVLKSYIWFKNHVWGLPTSSLIWFGWHMPFLHSIWPTWPGTAYNSWPASSSSSTRSLTQPVQQQWWRWWSSSGPPSPHIISGEVELLKATVRCALVGVCYIITRLKYYLNIGLYVELLKLKNENDKTDMSSVYL